ncbi:MAG: DMT family transporter [Deltaproteobacteria bacterium]|nr:DMT family transporter [Deltaproteobacteria bacterium]
MIPGELAALGTALSWTCSSLAFEGATRRLGSITVNMLRVVLAFGFLTAIAAIDRGRALPTDATAAQWGWLALSGLIGMVLGDLCLFRAYIEIGARRTMLVQTLAPVFTAIIGFAVLGEHLAARGILGIALVVAGVAWSVAERRATGGGQVMRARGLLLAIGGALGQAGGLVLSKRGLAGYDPVAGTQIRVLAGVVGFAIVVTAIGYWRQIAGVRREPRAVAMVSVGAFFGPCVGVVLSLYAVAHTQAGIVAAIIATTPIWLIGVALARREAVGARGVLSGLVAVAGVALLLIPA